MRKLLTVFALLMLSHHLFAQNNTSASYSKAKPLTIGVVEELPSKILAEKRILNVYLPEGYNARDTVRYPVIYLLDGAVNEDFIHIVGLVQFNSFEWINRLPKSIVVGIATVDRRRDFTYPTTIQSDKVAYPTTGHSDKFIAFIENELQPFIQSRYKTTDTKTLIGESLGGLLATEILFKKTRLFNKYIIVSPSLWWDKASLLDFKTPKLGPTAVYIGVGKEGLTSTKMPRVMEVDANLLADKLKTENKTHDQVFFDYLPFDNHATVMHQAVYNAIRLLYPDRKSE
ncbi:alpha/beta hydrolase-fold protein [Mucilaginibacter sp. CSA2-8R]|uniref:alpha/beta hydrolase n=1 Tax=Mucilaginibacter sp. CSA2-8R TaxID=3141542 RepID=UPI00315D311A